ncbi:MAG TPA: ABC transporter ATP-binding protein [Actinomycetota bacterium]|nr:ABC transporter ATP-binding protein [Actinomycetota bacterium]
MKEVPARPAEASAREPHRGRLLEVENLTVEFRTPYGVVNAVNGISYTLDAGETLAILGESGSGKSVSAQAVMGLIESPPGFITQGAIRFRGVDLLTIEESERRSVRGQKIAMIFQDALTSLNPVFSVGYQIAEMFMVHRDMPKRDAKKKAVELMERVGIPSAAERVNDYPHQFSGGMRQRVMIAMALSLDPDILIADEPTTALDVTVQAQIMELLDALQSETGMGLILITHDLGVVADVADRVIVMYAGKIVETGSVYDVYANPAHPYAEGLMQSIPRLDQKGVELNPIKGSPPNLMRIPSGCPFHPRCPYRQDVCVTDEPPLYEVSADRRSACHFWQDVLAGKARRA